MFQFWKATALKVKQTILHPIDISNYKLKVGLAVVYTKYVLGKQFTLVTSIYVKSLDNI